jgi:DNA invertase Pin-like site-specific DNA recombinase
MKADRKITRCAIYTRKSTDHGLELEFNSLHAQRDACEAYIKSQASEGWVALPDAYDDGAYSGGNLERPALQQLLKDIDAGRVDTVVVYKIDRLTRSLTDFARLVEAFDAKSISFVAVTQQFNTTTSMGRLTLNVLLSFAQFERELSSERVRDKVAASRRLGKWTGGTVPLGYDSIGKKLVPNAAEAETVRYIFNRYLEVKSFQKLIDDLDRRRIVTKRRTSKVKRFQGGVPFTYGSLSYFLKNRVYLGEIGHEGKWFEGDHDAIIDRALFRDVQALMARNAIDRSASRADSPHLLTGKLFDDRGNPMSPSFSVKKGVRYRCYVSSPVLRGRKSEAGSVHRVSSVIDKLVVDAVAERTRQPVLDDDGARTLITKCVDRIEVRKGTLRVQLNTIENASKPWSSEPIEVAWAYEHPSKTHLANASALGPTPDPRLVQSLVRAHAWVRTLHANPDMTIEELAQTANLHPKIVRQQIRAAFLDPTVTEACLTGTQPPDLTPEVLRNNSEIHWSRQQHFFAESTSPLIMT